MYCQHEPDETLVMLTLAGQQNAYEVLVTRHQQTVISSAMSITKNHFMAEDAAQDAFVTAWMKLNTLQDPKKYASWVCRIAKNCALNMINRYRSFLPLDIVDNTDIYDDRLQNPAELYALSEERDDVNKSIEKLPEKVRQIIHMHYFENLSIAEIADKMRISEGTVKWQLHDGRKRIRKDLCAMNEKYSDTLVQRVMKKVEEMKLWQFKNDKNGFEKVYKEVLREVEELPECTEKHHALADVLMRGWWWLPGKKNDALFARIANAAMEGKNEEVMTFIVTREDSQIHGKARIEFIRDKQIPRLEKSGFVKALGCEWFWLGYYLLRDSKVEEGLAAYDKVEQILRPYDPYYVLVPLAKTVEEQLSTRYKETIPERYMIGGSAEEYRIIDGKLRYWTTECFGEGILYSIDRESPEIFRNASICDGFFFADISLGETYTGSDGTKLCHISDNESVYTPAGKFDNCQIWETRRQTNIGKLVCRTYYKDGVGIVRQEHTVDGITDTHVLSAYNIKGGNGLIPVFSGNTWEYTSEYKPDIISSQIKFSVSFADDNRMILSCFENIERHKHDEDSWIDMVQKIADDYYFTGKDGKQYICDVYSVIERAEQLASTPMEKAHTKAAASVARRILATDATFNPDYTATGYWNFFGRNYIQKKNDSLYLTNYNPRWSFEWKHANSMNTEEYPILCNDILGILRDATNSVWSDEWRIGASPIVEYTRWSRDIRTQITCEDGGTVITKAGTFENCLKLCLDIGGMDGGWSYRGGKKVYYFAECVGIVRTENEYCGGVKTAVYELTSYKGTGSGFMPAEDGFVRRYDAIGLTDGFVGAAEYTYVADNDGDIIIFSDRTGIKEKLPPITQYSTIQGEIIENMLYNEEKWAEAHKKYAANNFHLILHLLARPSRNIIDAVRSIELNGFYMKIMELLGDGEVPPAWYSLYAWSALVRAAALFGYGRNEEGYSSLELSLKYCEKIAKFEDGELLDTGNPMVFGNAKFVWHKDFIQLPDGSKEPISYGHRMQFNIGNLLYAVTAPVGWEWFNAVRDEPRFKQYVEKAQKTADKN